VKAMIIAALRWLAALAIWLNALALALYLAGEFMPGHDVLADVLLGVALLTLTIGQAIGGWNVARWQRQADAGEDEGEEGATLEPVIVPLRSGVAYNGDEFVPAREC